MKIERGVRNIRLQYLHLMFEWLTCSKQFGQYILDLFSISLKRFIWQMGENKKAARLAACHNEPLIFY